MTPLVSTDEFLSLKQPPTTPSTSARMLTTDEFLSLKQPPTTPSTSARMLTTKEFLSASPFPADEFDRQRKAWENQTWSQATFGSIAHGTLTTGAALAASAERETLSNVAQGVTFGKQLTEEAKDWPEPGPAALPSIWRSLMRAYYGKSEQKERAAATDVALTEGTGQTPMGEAAKALKAIAADHPEWTPKQVESVGQLLKDPKAIVGKLANMLPYMEATTAAFLAAGPTGSGLVAYAVESQQAYDDGIARGLSPSQAQKAAQVTGAVNALIEQAQVGQWIKFGRGASAKIAREASKLAVAKMLAGKAARLAVEEGLEEALQGTTQDMAIWSQGKAPENFWRDRSVEFTLGSLGGLTMGGAQTAFSSVTTPGQAPAAPQQPQAVAPTPQAPQAAAVAPAQDSPASQAPTEIAAMPVEAIPVAVEPTVQESLTVQPEAQQQPPTEAQTPAAIPQVAPEAVSEPIPTVEAPLLTFPESDNTKGAAKTVSERGQKQPWEMSLDQFEAAGYRPADVTKDQWVGIMRRHMRSLGQAEESGTQAAPYADYENYWEADAATVTPDNSDIIEAAAESGDVKIEAGKATAITEAGKSIVEAARGKGKESFGRQAMRDAMEESLGGEQAEATGALIDRVADTVAARLGTTRSALLDRLGIRSGKGRQFRGMIKRLSDGRFLLSVGEKADVTTFLHEFWHFISSLDGVLTTDEKAALEKAYGVTGWSEGKLRKEAARIGIDGADTMSIARLKNVVYQERTALAWEEYHRSGKIASDVQGVRKAFAKVSQIFRDIYGQIKKLMKLSPEAKTIFDSMYGSKRTLADVRGKSDAAKQAKALQTEILRWYEQDSGFAVGQAREEALSGDLGGQQYRASESFTGMFAGPYPAEVKDRLSGMSPGKRMRMQKLLKQNQPGGMAEDYVAGLPGGYDELFDRAEKILAGKSGDVQQGIEEARDWAERTGNAEMQAKIEAYRQLEDADFPIAELDRFIADRTAEIQAEQEAPTEGQDLPEWVTEKEFTPLAEGAEAESLAQQDLFGNEIIKPISGKTGSLGLGTGETFQTGVGSTEIRDSLAKVAAKLVTDDKSIQDEKDLYLAIQKDKKALSASLFNNPADPMPEVREAWLRATRGGALFQGQPVLPLDAGPEMLAHLYITAEADPKARAVLRKMFALGISEQNVSLKDVASETKALPMEIRGKVLAALLNVKGKAGLKAFFKRVNVLLDEHDKRRAIAELKAAFVTEGELRKFRSPILAAKIRGIVDGLDLAKMTPRTKRSLEALQDFLTRANAMTTIPLGERARMAASVKRLDKTAVRDMDAGEIRDITRAIASYVKQNELIEELTTARNRRENLSVIAQATQEVEDKKTTWISRLEDIDPTSFRMKVSAARLAHWTLKFFKRGMLNLEEGAALMGRTIKHYLHIKPMEGRREVAQITRSQIESLKTKLAALGLEWGTKPLTGMRRQKVTVELTSGEQHVMTRSELLTLLAHLEQPNVVDQVLQEQVAFIAESESKQAEGWMVRMEDAAKLVKDFPLEQKIMQAIRDTMAELKQRLNEASLKYDGWERFKEDNYWRIATRALDRSGADVEPMEAWALMLPENLGFLKERMGKSGTIELEDGFAAFFGHLHGAANYIAMTPHIRRLMLMMNAAPLKKAIQRRFGQAMMGDSTSADSWIRRRIEAMTVTGARTTDLDKADSFLLKGVVRAKLAGKLSPILKQPAGIFALITELDENPVKAWYYMGRYGIPNMFISKWRELTLDHAPLLADRKENSASRLVSVEGASMDVAMGKEGVIDKLMRGLTWADFNNAVAAFCAFAGKLKETHPDLSEEAIYDEAGRLAELAVSRTQNAADSMDFTDMMLQARKSLRWRALTMFRSQALANFNTIVRQIRLYAESDKSTAAKVRLVHNVGIALILQAAWTATVNELMGFVYRGFKWRDDDEKMFDWVWSFLEDISDTVVGLSDVVSTLRQMLKAKPYMAGQTTASRTPVVETSERLVKGIWGWRNAIAQWDERFQSGPRKGKQKGPQYAWDAAEDTWRGLGLFGLPEVVVQAERAVRKAFEPKPAPKREPARRPTRARRQERR